MQSRWLAICLMPDEDPIRWRVLSEDTNRRITDVSLVGDPPVSLKEDGRAKIPLSTPPRARAGAGAAEAENAFPIAVDRRSLLDGLATLAVGRGRSLSLKPGFDRAM